MRLLAKNPYPFTQITASSACFYLRAQVVTDMARGRMFFEIANRSPNAFRDGLPIAVEVVVNVLYLAVMGRAGKESFDL